MPHETTAAMNAATPQGGSQSGVASPASPRPVPQWRKNRDRMDGMSLGIEMGLSVVLGWYLGKLFDDYFQTAPWGMAFFLLAGILAAGKAVLRFYKQAKKVMAVREPGQDVADRMGSKGDKVVVRRAEVRS